MRYHFKTRPFQHQVKALKRALKKGFLALLWEPGTGKSKLIVDWACALRTKGKLSRVLIVAPLSVLGVWEDEWAAHAPIPYTLGVLTRKGIEWVHKAGYPVVLVANYDIVWRRADYIVRFNPQMVVADESHRIKRPSARRSWYMRSLNHSPYRAILTGTPTPKSYLDLYSQWVFLNPKRFGTQVKAFKQRYIVYGGYMNKQIRGYMNVSELKSKVRADASIVKADKALDLPDKTFQRVPVELEDTAYKMYERMAYELLIELEDGEIVDAKNVGVKVMKLQQITGGFVFNEEGEARQVSTSKLDVLRDRLRDLTEVGEKVVVFARFRPEVEAIKQTSISVGATTFEMHGDVKQKDRDNARRLFQSMEGPAVFVLQIETGSLGITLHSARHAIFYSVNYALDVYEQAWRRIWREGQKRKVFYEQLVARRTIDLDVYQALKQKQNITDILLEDPSTLTRYNEVV